MPTLWTIGHSTHSAEAFSALLTAQTIQLLVDVRRFPGSRRYPHFGSGPLGATLAQMGIGYRHMPNLGGRRKARPDSHNVGWRNEGFRGYADYMETAEFRHAFDTLLAHARVERTVVMCAEAVPWRCHRTLIADAALARGWDVRHIVGATAPQAHVLTSFASLEGPLPTYPRAAEEPPSLSLF